MKIIYSDSRVHSFLSSNKDLTLTGQDEDALNHTGFYEGNSGSAGSL